MDDKQSELNRYFEWRERMRHKHRTMTLSEYAAWCRGGDAFSHPSGTNSFPGGLTLLLNSPSIVGKIDDWEDFR